MKVLQKLTVIPVVHCEHKLDGADVTAFAVHFSNGELLKLTTVQDVRGIQCVITITGGGLNCDCDKLTVVVAPDLLDHVSESRVIRRGQSHIVDGTRTNDLIDTTTCSVSVLTATQRYQRYRRMLSKSSPYRRW